MRPALDGKSGSRREDPAAVLPGADGVVMQPAPDGGLADGGSDAAGAGGAGELIEAPAGQRQAVLGGGFASQGANLHADLRGGSPGATGAREFLKAFQDGARRSACARG